ncbi:MAG: low-specificity L-threonine aldolase [Herpetosiphon sp.]
MIDLRSDTVTHPTPAMRAAMANAEVGDDVYGEDPTVNRLQEVAAELLGKEAALWVASGTMGNLVSLLAHGQRGDEIILGDESHIFNYEQGGASALGGLVFHTIPTLPTGELPLASIEKAIRHRDNPHYALPGLICLENTHNRCGGTVLSLDYMRQVKALAAQHHLPLHLDGARLPNAAVALGVPMQQITSLVDTVQLDLSKGLAAPVGGVVAGSRGFIARAYRARKAVGGGMRQAGVLAAAGILALTEMHERLHDDHANARFPAERLGNLPHINLDLSTVQTNIVVFRLHGNDWTPERLTAALHEHGVLIGGFGDDRLRMVTHYGIERSHLETTLKVLTGLLAA